MNKSNINVYPQPHCSCRLGGDENNANDQYDEADKMTLATLMTNMKLALMKGLGKRRLVTMAINKTWVPKSLTEINAQDL